ncbi:Antitoxin HicB [Serratia plymuthica]|nr:Antitoxin HicB [Serratia plymuthica]
MSCHYPAHYAFDNESDAWQIHFRDFPEQQAACYKREDIELEAQESLLIAIATEMEEGRPVPSPSRAQPEDLEIPVPVLVKLKLELHNIMLAGATSKADLARKLGFNGGQMDRLLDVAYASKVEALEQALYLLGYEVQVSLAEIRQQ